MTEKNKTENFSVRPPVVAVLGHIDHGKSTLLDYIRKTKTTEKESGGITQHISAYEAEILINGEKRQITFLDTPGHEAFCSVRARGAKVADIAILVISAEDGVKPQTLEALNCINENEMPFIVALNKIDKPGANIDKVKQNLAENNVLVEGWGGTVPIVPISAKTGEGVSDLLEMIALQADVLELRGDTSIPAEGFVIESHMNPKQGISATIIIKNGSIKPGMFVATEESYAGVRSIEASLGSPVVIVGWSAGPKVGSEFKTFLKKEEAIKFSEEKINDDEKMCENNVQGNRASWGVIIKADTFGSLDAVEHELAKLNNDKIVVKIISKDVGTINENDIKTAKIKKTPVLGFNVGIDKSAEGLALRDGIEIKTYKIIYDLVDYAKGKIKEATPIEMIETTTGSLKILKTFSANRDKQVIGGRIEEGEIKSGSNVKIFRRESLIGNGKIKELQIQKIKTDIVREGQEFGMMVESKIELVPGDVLKATALIQK
jgi:translation initiation factor IF-2